MHKVWVLLVVGVVAWAEVAVALTTRVLIAPRGEAAGDLFGVSVAAAGDVNGDGYGDVIVGAVGNDAGGMDAGRAYVYFGGPGADTTADLTLTGEIADGGFGLSVAGVGDLNADGYSDVVVGSRYANRAEVFFGGANPDSVADLVLEGVGSFGSAVAGAGDANGDGYEDVVIGAWRDGLGAVYVFHGGPGMDANPDWVLRGGPVQGLPTFGWAVAGAGDVNGDGYADVLVGAPHQWGGGQRSGWAYLFYGGVEGDTVVDLNITTNDWYVFLGFTVGPAGDINHDGYADFVVGMDCCPNELIGRAYVYYGGPGVDDVPDLTLTGEASDDRFGWSVDTVGDVNGDGDPDLIVGAHRNDAAGPHAGRAYVYLGGPGMDTVADLTLDGEGPGDLFGLSVGAAGDANGDGFADVVVGAPHRDSNGVDAGQAYVVLISPLPAEVGAVATPRLEVAPPWPNPARAVVFVAIDLPVAARVTLEAYDVRGRMVARVLGGEMLPASRTVHEWQPRGLPSGVYWLQARFGNQQLMRKVVWLGP